MSITTLILFIAVLAMVTIIGGGIGRELEGIRKALEARNDSSS